VPAEFAGRLTATLRGDRGVVLETDEPLAPLLGWLATLPLAEVRVEPVGLQAVYDRFHKSA
jgi:ABC-2 type transport system ATP-binding protein